MFPAPITPHFHYPLNETSIFRVNELLKRELSILIAREITLRTRSSR